MSLIIGLAGTTYWTMFSPYSQMLGRFPYRGDTSKLRIALTFDDGPNEPFTSQIADFLAEHRILATFFQVGECVERFPEVTRRLCRDGHVVGNHSASHRFSRCWSRRSQRSQTATAQSILGRVLDQDPALYRPPWLLRTPSLRAVLREQGLTPISGVFCHAWEVFQPSPQRIARRALAKARPGTILIFHDGFDARRGDRTNTVAAVKLVVIELITRGYQLVTIEELLSIPAYHTDS